MENQFGSFGLSGLTKYNRLAVESLFKAIEYMHDVWTKLHSGSLSLCSKQSHFLMNGEAWFSKQLCFFLKKPANISKDCSSLAGK